MITAIIRNGDQQLDDAIYHLKNEDCEAKPEGYYISHKVRERRLKAAVDQEYQLSKKRNQSKKERAVFLK